MSDEIPDSARLAQIARELVTIRTLLSKAVNSLTEAESEIPEKMRRFIMYMHDIHDVSYMYEERGIPVPAYIHREMERCDDRFRQLLNELHLDGGIFEKVRRDMAKDPNNRWDHTRQLAKPKEPTNETGQSPDLNGGVDENRTGIESGES